MADFSDLSSVSYSRSPTLPVVEIPLIFSALSLFYVIAYKIISLGRKETGDEALDRDPDDSTPVYQDWRQTFKAYDGLSIIAFRTVRLMSCLVLAYLQLVKPSDLYNLLPQLIKVPVYVSARGLSSVELSDAFETVECVAVRDITRLSLHICHQSSLARLLFPPIIPLAGGRLWDIQLLKLMAPLYGEGTYVRPNGRMDVLANYSDLNNRRSHRSVVYATNI